ncbi:MAG: sigma-70 family RNA polymerase sigma factor [Xanthomonadales bacterium]|nr:sigma-70 family RNA polymerase sigma factor [Xanthomonadales bacterium]
MAERLEQIDITRLLRAWSDGDAVAGAELMQVVYPLLREIAQARLRRSLGSLTLQATELVSEAYERLARGAGLDLRDRTHFFAVASRVIRNVVVDHARARGAEKRGGDLPFVPLESAAGEAVESSIDLRVDWLAVHDALDELEARDAHAARIVELKFFSGLTTDEIAESMRISRASVVREWRFARAWLATRLGP